MELSPDPRMTELREKISDIAEKPEMVAGSILADASVFGQDLSKTELAEPVIGFLKEMLT